MRDIHTTHLAKTLSVAREEARFHTLLKAYIAASQSNPAFKKTCFNPLAGSAAGFVCRLMTPLINVLFVAEPAGLMEDRIDRNKNLRRATSQKS
ncbi:hypothetical protein [Roseibium sp. MMSF_3544]|uniref:hypothetical protein n=1 Tax=unclassified Roseibium TaxID=2629323 RepID=UPI00273F02AC|nr:hypothetical protein [Roseibium sp. MMSF_3544]